MTALNWKDGGNKPLSYAVKCAICGEQIMVPTRDYYYAKDEESGKWVQAHAKCAIANLPKSASDEFNDRLIDELMMIREQLAIMNETLKARNSLTELTNGELLGLSQWVSLLSKQGAK